MTMKTKKIVLWYAVFVLALILNQSGAIQNDVKVIITSYIISGYNMDIF